MAPILQRDEAADYEIVVAGELDARWSDFVGGLTTAVDSTPGRVSTNLFGTVIDQSALIGILNRLVDLGHPILSVTCLGVEATDDT